MKQSMQRRLLRLEQAFTRGRDKQGRTPLEILLERRKRRLEASEEAYVAPPPLPPELKGATIIEILRHRYKTRAPQQDQD
jgi:hypothetical protein